MQVPEAGGDLAPTGALHHVGSHVSRRQTRSRWIATGGRTRPGLEPPSAAERPTPPIASHEPPTPRTGQRVGPAALLGSRIGARLRPSPGRLGGSREFPRSPRGPRDGRQRSSLAGSRGRCRSSPAASSPTRASAAPKWGCGHRRRTAARGNGPPVEARPSGPARSSSSRWRDGPPTGGERAAARRTSGRAGRPLPASPARWAELTGSAPRPSRSPRRQRPR